MRKFFIVALAVMLASVSSCAFALSFSGVNDGEISAGEYYYDQWYIDDLPYDWYNVEVNVDGLPSGLQWDFDDGGGYIADNSVACHFYGTPQYTGTYDVTIKAYVYDEYDNVIDSDTKNFSLIVVDGNTTNPDDSGGEDNSTQPTTPTTPTTPTNTNGRLTLSGGFENCNVGDTFDINHGGKVYITGFSSEEQAFEGDVDGRPNGLKSQVGHDTSGTPFIYFTGSPEMAGTYNIKITIRETSGSKYTGTGTFTMIVSGGNGNTNNPYGGNTINTGDGDDTINIINGDNNGTVNIGDQTSNQTTNNSNETDNKSLFGGVSGSAGCNASGFGIFALLVLSGITLKKSKR